MSDVWCHISPAVITIIFYLLNAGNHSVGWWLLLKPTQTLVIIRSNPTLTNFNNLLSSNLCPLSWPFGEALPHLRQSAGVASRGWSTDLPCQVQYSPYFLDMWMKSPGLNLHSTPTYPIIYSTFYTTFTFTYTSTLLLVFYKWCKWTQTQGHWC